MITPIRFQEGASGLRATAEVEPTAHPFPSTFEWTASQSILVFNDSRRSFGYPHLLIDNVHRSDSGMYTISATNRFLFPPMNILGSATGSFTLDVLCEYCLSILQLHGLYNNYYIAGIIWSL